jgi:nucleoside-diphosphate-sugar epimerase
MRVIVTGGSGFIGTNLIEYYLQLGNEVLSLDILPPRQAAHLPYWKCVNLLDKSELERIVSEFSPNLVLHMGARTDLNGQTVGEYAANTVGVSNLIEVLRKLSTIKFVVFASSMLVCRIGYKPQSEYDYAPSTPYGESKIEGERRVRNEVKNDFPWVIVRPTSIWGPWFDKPYRDFFETINRGLYFHPGGYRIKRSYGFVLNLIYQIDGLIKNNSRDLIGRTIYLSDYEPLELKTWADLIQKNLNVSPIREVPFPLFKLAAMLGDVFNYFNLEFPVNSFRLKNLLTEAIMDTGPIQQVVPNLPYDVNDAVTITCQWLKSRKDRD